MDASELYLKPLIMITRLLVTSSFFFILFLSLNAQNNKVDLDHKKSYRTKKVVNKAPSIDADLSDPVWRTVEWGGDFIQREPNQGESPTRETRFKILYDSKNLYVAFKCLDGEPEKIEKRLSRRDGFAGDWVEINIDSYHDLRSAFSFTITAAGVKGDEFISNDGNNWDASWDPIWFVKSAVVEDGWIAEARIPLSQLRFNNEEKQVWGIQINRRDFRADEKSNWQYVPNNSSTWVSEFGELHGIEGIKSQKQLEIQPYVLGKLENYEAEEGNPFATGKDFGHSIGVDGKIGITSDFTLDFTINPDFGQVEADPSVLNLDGFQVFFNERRPFFIEGRNIFDYRLTSAEAGGPFNGDRLFYSRRIGGAPHGYPDLGNNEYANRPNNTSILGAAKFSGKSKNGFSIGILESVTQSEYAEIDNDGERREELIEPLTNYFVGRVRQDLNEGNTVIGGMLTSVNRKNKDTDLDFLHKDAYSGGFDFLHRWNDQLWYVAGNATFSKVLGTKEAIENTQTSFSHSFQRVDANHLSVDTTRTSLAGNGGSLRLGKSGGGKRFNFEGGFSWRTPEFEINDIGFNRNTDEAIHFFWAGYRKDKPFSVFRNFRVSYNHWFAWDFSGANNYVGWNVNAHTQTKNSMNFGSGMNINARNIDTRALRGGPRIKGGNNINNWMYCSTNQRKKLVFYWNMFHSWGMDNDSKTKSYSLNANFQPFNRLRVNVGPSFNKNLNPLQYVENIDYEGQQRYVNATLNRSTISANININFSITPTMTIQYFGSPFITKGRYTEFKQVDNPLASNFNDQFSNYSSDQIAYFGEDNLYKVDENMDGTIDYSFGNPDFNFFQFRSNLVARWEYVPGSELFLVWSQGKTNFDNEFDELVPNLFGELFSNKAQNIFLVKYTYRFIK